MSETSFQQRVKMARDRVNLTQLELGRLVGVTGGAVSQWEVSGKEPPLETVQKVAEVCRVSLMWLAFGIGDIENEDRTSGVILRIKRGRLVPRLDMQTAVMERVFSGAQRVDVHTYFDCGPRTFVIEINDRSNINPNPGPSFEPGDAVAIDPDETPRPGDMVFAVLKPGDRGVLRRYQLRADSDGSKYIELSTLSGWDRDLIRSPSDGRIVGVMTEHVAPRR
jgi:transcriptional regulator with XRE-family HTH domain